MQYRAGRQTPGDESPAPVSKANVTRYQTASRRKAQWQLVNSLVPYALLWVAMEFALSVSYWLMLPLAILAAGFLVRIFIIFHDCCHGSFFTSRRANQVTGCITGLLNLTPFLHWRWQHALHHGTAGDLDRRGSGDIWTLTVQEYIGSKRGTRLAYRLARHPAVLFLLAPLYVFALHHRFAVSSGPPRERRSVRLTNWALLAIALCMSGVIGITHFLMIQLTVSAVAGGVGLWLFYVQHQFDGAYWRRGETWDYSDAALQGSSYYKLPRVLQWFSGNIGFHHIHHLSPRIANYHLEACHHRDPVFQTVKPVTLWASFKFASNSLWDEQRRIFVGFGDLRLYPR